MSEHKEYTRSEVREKLTRHAIFCIEYLMNHAKEHNLTYDEFKEQAAGLIEELLADLQTITLLQDMKIETESNKP
jgi:SOS response regulatory protein OraA/RecX